jgi:glycosyltransferase involved in cell wall biosynthesis
MLARLFNKSPAPKTIIFYRDFQEYTGGHQKVADYFQHLKSSAEFLPLISFSANTRWDSTNPWFPEYQQQQVEFHPAGYDIAFLAGMDWQVYLAAKPPKNQPVINLIQHVRHADPAQPMYEFLSQKAIRICVSREVELAIRATGRVNGPVFTIENGIALPSLPKMEKQHKVFIFGPKNPAQAQELEAELLQSGIAVTAINHWLPREQLLSMLAASRIVVLLPSATEGFYLPALEAMNYAELTVVPDCVGNRSFCHDRQNCLFPAYNTQALVAAVKEALQLLEQPDQLNIFKRNCADILAYHSLERERTEFLDLMRKLDSLW